MMKILVTMMFVLGACTTPKSDDTKVSCIQQAETACESADTECRAIIMNDCVPPPPCSAPEGQHC